VPFHQAIVDHNHALSHQQVASTNGGLPDAQAEQDAAPKYPCQTNPWNDTDFNTYRLGGYNVNTGIYGTSMDFPYDGRQPQPAFPMVPIAPVWDFDETQAFDQLDLSIPAGAQLIPATYSAMVSAPPAPIPAPAPAAADRIHCPHGCPATFGRGGEYRRHMMIHERPRYRCPMVDCPKTFSRADKLRDHAKRGHGGHNPLNL